MISKQPDGTSYSASFTTYGLDWEEDKITGEGLGCSAGGQQQMADRGNLSWHQQTLTPPHPPTTKSTNPIPRPTRP